MGVHYECGSDIPQDLEKAKWYYEKSAHQGFPDAQAALGNRLVVEERYEEGIGWLEKAVEMVNTNDGSLPHELNDLSLGQQPCSCPAGYDVR